MFQSIIDFFIEFLDKFFRTYDSNHYQKTVGELYLLFLISVPLSLLLFFLFHQRHGKTLVDLGHHKWIIKR